MKALKTAMLTIGLLSLAGASFAAPKITAGVGHMCCGSCRAAAKAGLAKLADDVTIDADNITLSPKGDDLLPTIEALRKTGFPAKTLVVSGPVTIGVAHLCCGGCRTGLGGALTAAKLDALDAGSIKIGEDGVTLKPKEGMKLDLIPLLAAMEKGGFSASRINVASATAKRSPAPARRIATR
jgi:hypothetical protein